jgi:hypothetical protein
VQRAQHAQASHPRGAAARPAGTSCTLSSGQGASLCVAAGRLAAAQSEARGPPLGGQAGGRTLMWPRKSAENRKGPETQRHDTGALCPPCSCRSAAVPANVPDATSNCHTRMVWSWPPLKSMPPAAARHSTWPCTGSAGGALRWPPPGPQSAAGPAAGTARKAKSQRHATRGPWHERAPAKAPCSAGPEENEAAPARRDIGQAAGRHGRTVCPSSVCSWLVAISQALTRPRPSRILTPAKRYPPSSSIESTSPPTWTVLEHCGAGGAGRNFGWVQTRACGCARARRGVLRGWEGSAACLLGRGLGSHRRGLRFRGSAAAPLR